MPVFIYTQDALKKLYQMEGPRWLEAEHNHHLQVVELNYNLSPESFLGAMMKFIEEREYFPGCVMYGLGGWNRYIVQSDGNMVFSKHHSNTEAQDKARSLGFDVW